MQTWLIKSEPSTWSWANQLHDKVTAWTGVRNHQAAHFLRAMKKGDLAFFYHSVTDKEIVGLVEVVREAYPDPTDETGKFVCVDVKAKHTLKTPITLAAIKATPMAENFLLLKQSRLSVLPVPKPLWDELIKNQL
jgi:predicted RNA-binding protein with PUA-like domain